MKKRLFGLVVMLPFLANAGEVKPSAKAAFQSILSLKKNGVSTLSILDRLSDNDKIDLLNLIPEQIQNTDNSADEIDLRSLENELKSSIHDTI
ncbi:MAG: hypothetical protein ACXVLQ_14685 [Bacteriovorax sp.]